MSWSFSPFFLITHVPPKREPLLSLSYPFLDTFLCTYSIDIRRRQWHPTPVLLPGKSHGWRSLVGYSPWGRKESDATKKFTFTFTLIGKHSLHEEPICLKLKPGTLFLLTSSPSTLFKSFNHMIFCLTCRFFL